MKLVQSRLCTKSKERERQVMVSGYQWSIVLGVGVLRPDIPLNPPSLSNDLLTSHTQTPPTTGDTERAPHHFDSIRILFKKKRNISCLKKESGFKFAGFYRVILETSRYLLEILLFFHADIFNFN